MSAGNTTTLSSRRDDPEDPASETLLNIDNYQTENPKERGLRTGMRVVAAFDGIAMAVIVTAILIQLGNEDNYIFLLNSPHILWWLFTIYLVGTAPSKLWFNLYIGLTAVWLVLDAISLIWRAILLHDCYQKSSSNSCRDFEIQSWFIILANGVLVITDIVLIVLSVLLRRYVVADRERAAKEEERCRRLLAAQRQRETLVSKATSTQSSPLKPSFFDTTALLHSQPTTTTTAVQRVQNPTQSAVNTDNTGAVNNWF